MNTQMEKIARKVQRLEVLLAGTVELAASIGMALEELHRDVLSDLRTTQPREGAFDE